MGRDVFFRDDGEQILASRAGVYQGLCLRGFESLVIKGACVSRIERNVES